MNEHSRWWFRIFCSTYCINLHLIMSATWQKYSMDQSPVWEADRCSASQEIPRLHVTPRFITVVTRVEYWSLFRAWLLQSTTAHTFNLRSILIFFSHLCLDLPGGLSPSDFRSNILYVFLTSPLRATTSVFLNLLNFIVLQIFGEWAYRLSSLLCHFSNLLLLPLSEVKILFSVLCSQTQMLSRRLFQ
jgi:hypothetical protein